ncbi:MAG: radical SAM protein [Desulfobacterales bacterium]|nr:radical SAM protein [Desulfobacterales bacterium]
MKPAVTFNKEYTNIFFHILTACNLSCSHCYINKKQHGEGKLPLETIIAWLSWFKPSQKKTNLVLLGGEPSLHPDLPKIVEKARELSFRSITIDTNGFLFHDLLNKTNPNHVDLLNFSLDGATAKTNDMIRGEGSYKTCILGIQNAIKKGFQTGIIYTVSRNNFAELKDMVPIVESLGVDRFFIQIIGLRGNLANQDNRNIYVDKDAWLSCIPDVAKEIASLGTVCTYPKVYLDIDDPFECAGLLSNNYFIFPNGRVYQCPLCEDYPLHSYLFMGNQLQHTAKINEKDLFSLNIPEGCVMNKLIQPYNIQYDNNSKSLYKIACCLLKEEIS